MDLAFVPGTSAVAAVSVDGSVRVWDLNHVEEKCEKFTEVLDRAKQRLSARAKGLMAPLD